MKSIKAVIFDYGMVLSAPPDPAAWQRIRVITGFSEQVLQRSYWQFRHAYDRGDLSGLAYWEQVAAYAETNFTPEQVQDLIVADVELWTRINTPMLDWAQRLQRAGTRTGILSNIGDAMAQGLLNKFQWLDAFDHLIWSYRLRIAKPEPAIYHAAAEGLETPLPNILFIDDRLENVEAARKTGMHAVQYLDHAAFVQELEQRGLSELLRQA